MIKAGELQQGLFLNRTGVLMLLSGLAVLSLAGCESTNAMRAELAPPPPAFDPATYEINPSYEVSMTEDETVSAIEPAAGAMSSASPVLSAAPSSCGLRMGGAGDALFYQWGGERLGIGMGSAQRDHDFGAVAALRFSVSLDSGNTASKSSCLGNALSGD